MIENGLNEKNYYDDYRGWDLGLMLERLKSMRMPRGEFSEIGWKEKINMLVLGSATPDNLFRVAQIDHLVRPGKAEQDRAVIIDLNRYPLEKHKREIDWIEDKIGWGDKPMSTPEFPLPKFELAQADMRALPFKEGEFDLVISDYTLNYLDKFEEVDKVFEEMARTLCSRGIALLSVRGNEKYPPGKNIPKGAEHELQTTKVGGIEVKYFPLKAYLESAERHGFDMDASETIGTDICVILRKSDRKPFI